ncbi:type 2 periplasmic-binding domain-containing protein [Paenibacillus cymbidii]|uniref:extracellular solute-binding protein n=1 Tax=Paenibacillus cymbidii TaxID=1639034 RepID=UPI00107FE25F|nr:extracellular solute-binding protein [Paenibacillus cymbidii]
MSSRPTIASVRTGLAIALLAIALAACDYASTPQQPSGGDRLANLNETGFPIVEEPIRLTFFSHKSNSNTGNWNDTLIWREYARMTNMTIDFQLTNVDVLPEKRNLVFASGELPDAFHTAVLPTSDLVTYGSQGVLIRLNELIDKYAPNLKAYMNRYPEIRKGMTMPDGNIYAFPSLIDPGFTSAIIGSQLWINEPFLKALGMSEPQTTEELYRYFQAVKTKDPNGNGLADEIPLALYDMSWLIDQLKGAWGLGNRGNNHPKVDVDPAGGKLRYIPADPKYKEVLQYLNRFYAEGFFYKDVFTIKPAEVNAKFPDGLFGGTLGVNPNVSLQGVSGYIGVGALAGPGGERLFSRAKSPMPLVGGMAITRKNPYPEATVRWADYFYGDEGIKLFLLGVKDKSYTEKNGKPEWIDEIRTDPGAIGKYVTWAGGWYPSVLKQQYFLGHESSPENVRVSERIKPYFPQELWPPFSFTKEEVGEYAELETDLNAYVSEMAMKFITGSVPFLKWDEYVATLKRMGMNRYLELYDAAYRRYKTN